MYNKFIPAKKAEKNCLQKGLVQVTFRETSLATILDKIDRKFVPLRPKSRMGKWRVLALRGFFPDFGGTGDCCSIFFCPRLQLEL